MSRLALAIDQIKLTRLYTLTILDTIPDSDWFRMPAEGVTHVGWQAGHLAVSHFFLLMSRIRGDRPGDVELFPKDRPKERYVELFGRLTVPSPDPSLYPPPAEIKSVLARIHTQALSELPSLSDTALDEQTCNPKPHPIITTRLSALLWCAQHEMIHAGQIGLLRRLLGSAHRW